MWWIASAIVLLFVALAVVPVAAAGNEWSDHCRYSGICWNYTVVHDTANLVRFPPFPSIGSPDNDYAVNFTMINGTGGMNAVHISNSYSSPYGQCNAITGETEGEFFITDTGGRGYQDNIILLIGVASDDSEDGWSDRMNTEINIDAAGYSWTPHNVVNEGPSPGEPVWTTTDVTVTSADYATDAEGGVYQNWKFAPNPNFPWYCGQNPSLTTPAYLFNWTAVDLKMGLVPNTSLTNNGMIKVNYTLNNNNGFNSENTKIAFNVYAYNRYTSQGWNQTLWLNRVNTSAESETGCSGWLVSPY